MDAISAINAFNDNYIWLITDPTKRFAIVVDPGDPQPVLKTLQEFNLALAAILITHHHFDHIGGVPALTNNSDIPVFGPAGENISFLTKTLEEGDSIELPNTPWKLDVLDVPGHTAGHIAYSGSITGESVLFCGDTLFSGGCGRLFEGTAEQMFNSLSKFAHLPENTLVYCAHEYTQSNLQFAAVVEPGNEALKRRIKEVDALRSNGKPTIPTTIGLELQTNPFLRCEQTPVIASATSHFNTASSPGWPTLKLIREWKDNF